MEGRGWVWKMCNKIWKGEAERWQKKWRVGVLILIVKKGQETIMEEYRGITVMPALYKIYACVSGETERGGGRERVVTTESNRIQERDGDNR